MNQRQGDVAHDAGRPALSTGCAFGIAGLALMLLEPMFASAQGRTPIVQSLELAVLQPPALVNVGGIRHLVYELHISNLSITDVALQRVEVLDAERSPAVLGDFQDATLQGALGRPGMAKPLADNRQIGAGLRAVFYAWMPLGNTTAPSALSHRIAFDVIHPDRREPRTMQGGRASVRRDSPLVLGAPVQGGRWVAVYGPGIDRGHRRFIYTTHGRSRIPARFAIDWKKIGDGNAFARGDPTQIANWYGYGANVLAVADATVVDIKDDILEDTPISSSPTPMALENASGDYVVLELGRGRYAFYEHLKHGSIRVKIGDRVRRGDVIGLLGNTGSSSSGPHLHFHVSDANALFGAEGLPYVFDTFEVLGQFHKPADAAGPPTVLPLEKRMDARRRRELPAPNAVVRF